MLGHFLLHMYLHCSIDIYHMTTCRNTDTGIGMGGCRTVLRGQLVICTQPLHTGDYQLSAVYIDMNYPKTAWWYLNAQSNAWGVYAVTDNDDSVLK